jgi:hypothetical protein
MGRPKPREALIRNARAGQPFTRVQIARVTCPRCHQGGILALPDGVTPRAHLKPSTPEDDIYSSEVPTRVECQSGGDS